MRYLQALTLVYVDSASTASLTAAADTYYIVDTATAAVTITLPSGIAIGHWIVVQNAPASGFQMGGAVTGSNVTVAAGSGETLEGASTDTVVPPVSTVTAAAHKYFPVGAAAATSGFGAGWAVM